MSLKDMILINVKELLNNFRPVYEILCGIRLESEFSSNFNMLKITYLIFLNYTAKENIKSSIYRKYFVKILIDLNMFQKSNLKISITVLAL